MRNSIYLLSVISTVIFLTIGCSNPMDERIGKQYLEKVKKEINSDQDYGTMKKKYIVNKLSSVVRVAEMRKVMHIEDESSRPTFREIIKTLSTDYDSIKEAKLKGLQNNKKLENFVELKEANAIPIDEYKGYLSMTLDFNNPFDKEIRYIILDYRYIDNYDTQYFDQKSKLTDEVAGDFKGEVKISMTEKYSDAAKFLYKHVPVRANEKLRVKLGKKEADKKVRKDFLMKGLNVSTYGIVFKDKSKIIRQDADWEYFGEND